MEGRTDEKYFKKAAEVYGINTNYEFKWIGHIDEKGQEANTGASSLDKARQFFIGKELNKKVVLLYDCDTKKENRIEGKLYTRVIPCFDNGKGMRKGIENALVLDNINTEPFYTEKTEVGDYGEKKIITTFEKMKLCDYICELDNSTLKMIFKNLRDVIEELGKVVKEN